MIVQNEQGEDIEVFTQEEVETLAAEKAQEEIERIAQEKQDELDRVLQEKEEAEQALQKLRDKDMNFEQLKKSKKAEVSEELRTQISSLEEKINQLAEQPKNDTKAEFIRTHIGADKEKEKLFDYYYEKLGTGANSKEDIIKAANEALTLATGGEYKPDVSSSMYSVSPSDNYRNVTTKEVSDQSKQIGNLLGITDEDRKKYGKKDN